MYLINDRWHIVNTGIVSQKISNSIFDGEYVLYNKLNNYNPQYLIYDCYYLNSVDIRDLPLNIPKKDSRMPKLQKAIKEAEWEYIENDSEQLKIRVKKFYYGDIDKCGTTIFQHCKTILNQAETEMMEYETDGLIFTPSNLAVGSSYVDEPKIKNTGKTWKLNFKWKPPEDNTIDFLVEIVKDKSSGLMDDKIGYLYRPQQELLPLQDKSAIGL